MTITQVGNVERNFVLNSTSITVNVPSGVINGHVLIAAHMCWATPTTPSGWTLQREHSWTAGGYTRWLVVYSRVASNEPSSYTFTTSAPEEKAAWITAWAGVDTTTPVDVTPVSGNSSGSSSSMVAPSFTTITGGCEILFVGFVGDSGAGGDSVTPPSGYTELLDYANSWTLAYLARMSQTTAGSVSSATATSTGNRHNAAVHMALRPSGGAAATSNVFRPNRSFGGLIVR